MCFNIYDLVDNLLFDNANFVMKTNVLAFILSLKMIFLILSFHKRKMPF